MCAQSSHIDSIFALEYADSIPPLSKAARSGDLEKIKKLLLKGISPHTPDNRGWTAIHCCVAENQVEALKLILKLKSKNKRFLVNLTTWENVTPLAIAMKSSRPSLEMVKLLLKAGADPKQYTHTKLSPLHLACLKKGNIEFVKLLVRHGADVNVQEDLSSSTPLHFAVSEGCDIEIIKFLLNLSDLSLINVYGRTAFLEACNSNFLEAVEIFLEKDKSLANLQCNVPPLVYAGLVGNLQMAQLLIDSGAEVNCRCEAIVTCQLGDSDLILFDAKDFLPIHSSFTNVQVFKLLLRLTDIKKLQQLKTGPYTFPIFVLVYGGESSFETLMESDLPDDLKTFSSEILVKFFTDYPDLKKIMTERLPLIFKHNFSFEAGEIFKNLVQQMSRRKLCTNIKLLHTLAQMGISSDFQTKNTVISILQSFMNESKDSENLDLIKATCDLLSQSVLSLKQYCRIVLRRAIGSAKSNQEALNVVKYSNIPDSLKKFILFESFT